MGEESLFLNELAVGNSLISEARLFHSFESSLDRNLTQSAPSLHLFAQL